MDKIGQNPEREEKHLAIWHAVNNLELKIDKLEALIERVTGESGVPESHESRVVPNPTLRQFLDNQSPRITELWERIRKARETLTELLFGTTTGSR